MRLLALDAERVESMVGEASIGGGIVSTVACSSITARSEEMKTWQDERKRREVGEGEQLGRTKVGAGED